MVGDWFSGSSYKPGTGRTEWVSGVSGSGHPWVATRALFLSLLPTAHLYLLACLVAPSNLIVFSLMVKNVAAVFSGLASPA